MEARLIGPVLGRHTAGVAENQTSEQGSATDEPTVIILYGGTGDLAKRLVLPAFWELHTRGLLPKRWKLVGNGRGDV